MNTPILAVALAVIPPLVPSFAIAQSYPTKPIRILVGVPPGGAVDGLARASAQYLSPLLGQPIIVDNRPGASNLIANQLAANATPDGHTILSLGVSQAATEAAAIANGEELKFDTLKQLTLVTTVVANPYGLIVRADLPAKSVNEFIALAKTKPQSLSYGSTGVGKIDHIAVEMLQQRTGMQLLHVPYKGAADAMNQLLPGRIDVMFNSVAPIVQLIRSDRVKLLGLMGTKRTMAFPDVPTIAEAIPLKGYGVDVWIAMGVPINTPAAIVNRLNNEYKKMLSDEAFVSKVLTPRGLEPFYKTPADSTATFRAELEKYTKLIKDIGLKIAD